MAKSLTFEDELAKFLQENDAILDDVAERTEMRAKQKEAFVAAVRYFTKEAFTQGYLAGSRK